MTLKPLVLRQGLSLVNLETRLCLLKHSWINLEANAYPLKRPCLILLWHHQNSCMHTFTFSPFLTMTIKWFLFNIIKTMHDPHITTESGFCCVTFPFQKRNLDSIVIKKIKYEILISLWCFFEKWKKKIKKHIVSFKCVFNWLNTTTLHLLTIYWLRFLF